MSTNENGADMAQDKQAHEGRSFLVVGSDGGLGTAVTAALRAEGHQVTGLDRPMVDLTERGVVAQHVEALWNAEGPFDGLVHAAGLFPAAVALETSEEMFDRLMAVNARSAMIASATVARLSIADGRPASIVVVSSGAALRPQVGTMAYAASKAALQAIVRGLALETGPSGIRVNAVAPGFFDVGSRINPVPDEYVSALAASAPQRRVATPEDIVPSIMWLLSDASHWMNGQALTVDGGASLGSIDRPTWLTRTT
ncbi:SDR family NAD(P)-dependent oxidoreductase [Aeromicrobium wangtongii]|uniref:SDR family NAD(P)-dependent oxidoreductase n=1 Tax=Aeromicrobium wangtongii TaxID=2969247 RepID=UPI002016D4A0|nr:SDR family oxidoreductase [Aeromicrobium wangtongii]MCL3816960.1 SDR family oxidoreductase [Aeromicrobium wangtongii]